MATDYTGRQPRHYWSEADEQRVDELLAKVAEQDELSDIDRLTLAIDKLARVLEARDRLPPSDK